MIDVHSLARRLGSGLPRPMGLAAFVVAAIFAGAAVPAEWSYRGSTGPLAWGRLSADNAACDAGERQSPIDIHVPTAEPSDFVDVNYHPTLAALDFIDVDYRETILSVWNNGRTVLVAGDEESTVTIGPATYRLLQFHFHSPSEHRLVRIDEKTREPIPTHFAMEIHFVHENVDVPGDLMVIAIMVKEQLLGRHPSLQTIAAHMSPAKTEDPEEIEDVRLNPDRLFPLSRRSFRYYGSLTTPPCTEGVTWVVLTDWVGAEPDQVDAFRAVMPRNNRPTHEIGKRFIILTD